MAPLIAVPTLTDLTTIAICVATLTLLALRRVPEPLIVAAGAAIGVIARVV